MLEKNRMQRKNLFDGDSYKAQFALITYRWLMSHRWVSYADIMADYIGVTTKELPANLSNCDGYGGKSTACCPRVPNAADPPKKICICPV